MQMIDMYNTFVAKKHQYILVSTSIQTLMIHSQKITNDKMESFFVLLILPKPTTNYHYGNMVVGESISLITSYHMPPD